MPITNNDSLKAGDLITTFGPDGGSTEQGVIVSGSDSNGLCKVRLDCDGKVRVRHTNRLSMRLVIEWHFDTFGRKWPFPLRELCPTCRQPDNMGECNHQPLAINEVEEIGGTLSLRDVK